MAGKLIEEWRAVPLPKYQENYEVSNLGEVRNKLTGRVLTKSSEINGYLDVTLTSEGISKPFKVHRLVALAFIPNDDPGNKIQVNHKNGIKTDNTVNNLEWTTRKENCRHARSVGLGGSLPVAKMTLDHSQIIQVYGNIIEAATENRIPITILRNALDTNHAYQNYNWYYLSDIKDKFPGLFRQYRETRRGANKERVNTLNNSVNNKMILLLSLDGYPIYLFRNFSEIGSLFELEYNLREFESLPILKNHYWIMYKDFLEEYEELDREKVNRLGLPKLKWLIADYNKRMKKKPNMDYTDYQYFNGKPENGNILKKLNDNLGYVVSITLSVGAIAKMYSDFKNGSLSAPHATEELFHLFNQK